MDTENSTTSKAWIVVAVTGILFFLSVMFNDGVAPWKSDVLFDCPPLGDGLYVELDPHEGQYPQCEFFGPPLNSR